MVKMVGNDQLHRDQSGKIHLPLVNTTTDLQQAINFVFPPEILSTPQAAADRASLCGTNAMVDTINKVIVSSLPGEARSYFSSDSDAAQQRGRQPNPLATPDLLHARNFNGMPPHHLLLKQGQVCFLERNLSLKDGLMHSSKVVVTNLYPSSVEFLLLHGRNKGQTRLIPRITFQEPWKGTAIILKRVQIPLRPAYAMTFNKSQGQTLDRVVLDIRNPIFAHGQLYVGLSRVRDRISIIALVTEDDEASAQRTPYSYNIVDPHLKEVVQSIESTTIPVQVVAQ